MRLNYDNSKIEWIYEKKKIEYYIEGIEFAEIKNNKIYVKNGVLYLPNSYHASFKSPDTLMIYDETVTYKDSTLGLVND